MRFFDYLIKLRGSYPEQSLISLSSILGRTNLLSFGDMSDYWLQYASYRTPASICNATAKWLWRFLEKSSPTVIVEFGTGFSTYVIGAYAAWQKRTTGRSLRIVSVEHDEYWYERQRETLNSIKLQQFIELAYSPLSSQRFYDEELVVYSEAKKVMEKVSSKSLADFVFVDGPLAIQYGGPGREGTIAQAIDLAREGGPILIHDALRSEEFTAIQKVTKKRPALAKCIGIIPVWYGLAVMRKLTR